MKEKTSITLSKEVLTGIDRIELVEARIPEPGPAQVVVEAFYTANDK